MLSYGWRNYSSSMHVVQWCFFKCLSVSFAVFCCCLTYPLHTVHLSFDCVFFLCLSYSNASFSCVSSSVSQNGLYSILILCLCIYSLLDCNTVMPCSVVFFKCFSKWTVYLFFDTLANCNCTFEYRFFSPSYTDNVYFQ